ncbi:HAD-IB family hydrolase [Marivirga lumbricoides]|uniref:HAD-IB family hydrolase n=1 Tax=Marivirga lumbricoides TaxID=1046115 RepID=A0A2T4DRT3_9BACT|nr:HAD-IB family hydrolase [Marivirga lumbricoides]
MKNLVLFDFDGTISKKDSMIEFLKYYSGKTKFYLTFLGHIHWIIGMHLGIIEKWRVKQKIWVHLFRNTNEVDFNQKAEFFSLHILPHILYKDALERIKSHKAGGDRVIIITASAANWISPWCKSFNVELISTCLEVKNGIVTGKIEGKNCNGIEKVHRIKQLLSLSDFKYIYAYGNSKGDKEMLDIASHPFYKFFQQ